MSMRRAAVLVAVVLALATVLVLTACDPSDGSFANPTATSSGSWTGPPGEINPSLDLKTICTPGWSSETRPDLPTKRGYQYDHFYSRALGGADTPANLWYVPLDRAKRFDSLERSLHVLVCKGDVRVEDALQAEAMLKRSQP